MVSFVPLCLFQQFTRFANFWFLMCCTMSRPCCSAPLVSPLGAHFVMLLAGILQAIRVTSLTGGLPLTAVPLSFVLIISMLREGIEDYSRYKSDLEVHARAATAYRRFMHIDDSHTARARD